MKNRHKKTKKLIVKKQAFTLAEVLIALFILTGSVYVLSGLTFRSSRKVMHSADEVERIFFLKKYSYFYTLHPGKVKAEKPQKISLENPDVQITVERKGIDSKKSALKDFAKEIEIVFTEGTWSKGTQKHRLNMISFVPKPQEKTEK